MKLVAVSWIDSHTDNDWKTVENAKREASEASALMMRSVGYVVEETTEYVLLAGTWSPGVNAGDDLVNNTMQIPRVAVTEVRALAPDTSF